MPHEKNQETTSEGKEINARDTYIDPLDGAALLLGIREGRITDWHSACAACNCYPGRSSLVTNLNHNLLQLREAQIIDFPLVSLSFRGEENWPISLTPSWEKIQTALNISLSGIVRNRGGMVVRPTFGKPIEIDEPLDFLMLMPFESNLDLVFSDHISPVVQGLGLSIKRGDDFFQPSVILKDIWSALHHSRAVIADCTGRNANVFYEIGIAHTLGKKTILIGQDPNDIPFNIRHFRILEYVFSPRGMKDFELRLRKSISETFKMVL